MRTVRFITVSAFAILIILALLRWPAARWLEERASWLPAGTTVDAVYMMSGQWNHERVDGLVEWLAAGGKTGRILLATDSSKGRWSRQSQRNLSTGEWDLETLLDGLANAGLDIPVEVITTSMEGTDAELAALARVLSRRPDIRTLAISTSRFHVRRTRQRAGKYLDPVPGIVPAIPIRQDRSPSVVSAELGKMLRDVLGLSNAPVVGQRWWRNWSKRG